MKTLGVFSWLFKLLRQIFIYLIFKPLGFVAVKFWQLVIINIYQGYLLAKRFTTELLFRHNNKLAIVINNKLVLPIIIILLALAVVTNNIAAKETTRDNFGRNSLLFIMVQDEFGGHEIIEDSNPAQLTMSEQPSQQAGQQGVAAEEKMGEVFETEEDNLNVSQAGSALVKQNLIAPEQVRTRTQVETYTVQAGDTASSIAQRFGLSVNSILWANNLSKYSIIRPGDELKILPENGLLHKIEKNDTLVKIADKYQADEISIIEFNESLNPQALAVGETIFIPGGVPPAPKIQTPAPSLAVKNIFIPPPAAKIDTDAKLLWPAKSHRINQYFSWRHTGIDIDGNTGNPAYAAESGKVTSAGWTRGYGYNVVINHGNGITTLQGHMSKLLVKAGDTVERGDTIALIGSTGWSTGAHIHFEVRVNGVKVNPLTYTQ